MSGSRFSKATIQAWYNDLTRIPLDITIQEKIIEKNQIIVDHLDDQLASVTSIIAPMDQDIAALEARQTILVREHRMKDLATHIATQQKNILPLESELITKENVLAVAIADTRKIEALLHIKDMKGKEKTLPLSMTVKQQEMDELRSCIQNDANAVSRLTTEIMELSESVTSLEAAVRRDSHMHSHHDYHDHHHHHGHHHHHSYHGHGRHHDHHHSPGLLDAVFGGIEAIGESIHAANDANRDATLNRQRLELDMKRRQRDTHQSSLLSHQTQLTLINHQFADLQREWDATTRFLASVSRDDLKAAGERKRILDEQLREKQDRESAILSERNTIQRSLSRYRSDVAQSQQQHDSMLQQNTNLQLTATPYKEWHDLSVIEAKLASAHKQKAPHVETRTALRQQKSDARAAINAANAAIAQSRQQNANSTNSFLVQLRDTPDQLLQTLVENCNLRISVFDRDHDEQSVVVFSVIEELRRDIAVINRAAAAPAQVAAVVPSAPVEGQPAVSLFAGEPPPPAYAASAAAASASGPSAEADGLPYHPARSKYYQAVGLLHSKIARLAAGEPDSDELIGLLRELVRPVRLDSDEMQADYDHLHRPLLAPEAAIRLQVERYNDASTQFQLAIKQARSDVSEWKKFGNAATTLLQQIEENRRNPAFNTLFYTRYLQAAHQLFEHPTSVTKRELYQRYAGRDQLTPANNCKRSGGIAGLFASTALLATTYLAERFGYREQYELPHAVTLSGYGVAGAGMLTGLYGLFSGQAGGSVRSGQQFFTGARTISPHYGVSQVSSPTSGADEFREPLLNGRDLESGSANTAPASTSSRLSR